MQGNLIADVKTLKTDEGPPMAILGSGSLVAQLIEAGLLDERQVRIVPATLGGGKKPVRRRQAQGQLENARNPPLQDVREYLHPLPPRVTTNGAVTMSRQT